MNRGARLVLAALTAPLVVPLVVLLFFKSSNDAIWAEIAFVVSGVIAYGSMLFLGLPVLLYLREKGLLHVVAVVLSGVIVGIIVGVIIDYTILLKAGSSRPFRLDLIAWSAGAGFLIAFTFSILAGLPITRRK
ncbi:MAG TPA: hypothetical protein PKH39_14395 [Woeseiaceae bacterium]|nr:hypothetical protein [Woeseiaceae bacterium]